MKNIFIVLIISIVLCSCKRQANYSVDVDYYHFEYSYYVTDISICNAVIVLHNNKYYIIDREKLQSSPYNEVTTDNGFLELYVSGFVQSKRICNFPSDDSQYINEFPNQFMVPTTAINGYPTYKFKYTPLKFAVILCAKNYSVSFQNNNGISSSDQINNITYSDEYVIRIIPLFSAKDRKLINRAIYQYINQKEADWVVDLPIWLFNFLDKIGIVRQFSNFYE